MTLGSPETAQDSSASFRFVVPEPISRVEPGPVPTLSVLIAAYQAAGHVARAIESALGQTAPPHEVIVCDDGSSDDIEAAVEPYRDRIVFLRREHGGESAAKNTALEAATGDFVSILDSDDSYLPRRNEAVVALARLRPDLDIITTECYIVIAGRRIEDGSRHWRFEVADQRTALLERNYVFPAVAVRRSRLLAVGGFDKSMVGTTDWDCWLRLVFSGSIVGKVDEPLAEKGLHEAALSSDPGKMAKGEAMALEKAARTLPLSAAERGALERSLKRRRRRLEVEEVREALLEGSAPVRRRAATIALWRGCGFRTRSLAALTAAMPGLARRFILARDRRRWVGAGGVRVSRD